MCGEKPCGPCAEKAKGCGQGKKVQAKTRPKPSDTLLPPHIKQMLGRS